MEGFIMTDYEKISGKVYEKTAAIDVNAKIAALKDTIDQLQSSLDAAKAEKAALEALK